MQDSFLMIGFESIGRPLCFLQDVDLILVFFFFRCQVDSSANAYVTLNVYYLKLFSLEIIS